MVLHFVGNVIVYSIIMISNLVFKYNPSIIISTDTCYFNIIIKSLGLINKFIY